MEFLDFSNPLVLIIGGVFLLSLVLYLNKYTSKRQRSRGRRSFRNNYYERRKEQEKKSEQ